MKIEDNYRQKFYNAFRGIFSVVITENSMKIHLVMAALVIIVACVARLALWKWAVLLLTIGLVLITEIINTAIETVVDLYCESYHPKAKLAKDIAAGAVLVAAIIAVLMGIVIFLF